MFSSRNVTNLVKNLMISELYGTRGDQASIHNPCLFERLEVSQNIDGHTFCITCQAFDNSGRFFYTAAKDNEIKCWSVVDGLLKSVYKGHKSEISHLAVSHDRILLASASVDKQIRIWNILTTASIKILLGHFSMILDHLLLFGQDQDQPNGTPLTHES